MLSFTRYCIFLSHATEILSHTTETLLLHATEVLSEIRLKSDQTLKNAFQSRCERVSVLHARKKKKKKVSTMRASSVCMKANPELCP